MDILLSADGCSDKDNSDSHNKYSKNNDNDYSYSYYGKSIGMLLKQKAQGSELACVHLSIL